MIDFINNTTQNIAQQLLWKLLVYKKNWVIYSGYIVETEAYLWSDDMACHSYNFKRTQKNESMYLPWWHIYIYTVHTHKMLNIVTKQIDTPEAVLIRAIEPAEWIENMEKNRKSNGINLTNWPWKLTKAFEIDDELNGEKLNSNVFWYLIDSGLHQNNATYPPQWGGRLKSRGSFYIFIDFENSKIPKKIENTARIWIPNKGKRTNEKLRYYVKGNAFVSGVKKGEIEEGSCWEN
jgi:DNA-3-methyladenine glycosylase